MKTKMVAFCTLFSVLIITAVLYPKGGIKNKNRIAVVSADSSKSLIDINNLTSWVNSAGFRPALVDNAWNGKFPKSVDAGLIFQEGVVWGGLVYDGQNPQLRVGGNTYVSGTTPVTRLFRVRTDYKTADLTDDAANFFMESYSQVTFTQISQIKDQYAKDWNDWPADKGAPYKDVNNDGSYEPSVDIPGVPGASQTIWIEYNDDNASHIAGSPSIGLDVQETIWAYNISGALGNTIFKKVDILYKGTSTTPAGAHIDSMYISQWADPDNGNSVDDFSGCDTSLDLGYAYNASTKDAIYSKFGISPPAVGYTFLQGVSEYTGNPSDSALFNFHWRKGYKYVNAKPMSGFTYFAAGGTWSDPDLGAYSGTEQWYNLIRDLPRPPYPNAESFSRPSQFGGPIGGAGTYLLDGDPVSGSGWVDGIVDGPGDRRIEATSGPFSMHLGDKVEIVTAEIAAEGNSNLAAVGSLKFSTKQVQSFYKNMSDVSDVTPLPVELTQFTAHCSNNSVVLAWSTSTETNNNGFEIQKSMDKMNFESIGFIQGNGTTTEKHSYSYIDKSAGIGISYYKLKQIDYSGTYKYSKIVEVNITNVPAKFDLSQNYPNPFNPTTVIRYAVPKSVHVKLNIYNSIGERVKTLINENKKAGTYNVTFSGSYLPSGVYFYHLLAGEYSAVKKFVLLK